MNHLDAADVTPEQKIQLLTRAIMRRAKKAAEDPCEFFEFAIREETSKAKLKAAPHQKLMFSFAGAHPWSVTRAPIGHSKTYFTATESLFNMGRDCTTRGSIISKTQRQSKKVLAMPKGYIEDPILNVAVAAVFPDLQQSPRAGDPWTNDTLTVKRPAGIRDPSLFAAGIEGKVQGARLSWAVADDIIDDQSTKTKELREQTIDEFENRVISRMDPVGSKICVTNTPWHREDLTFYLEGKGWPTITMDVYGFIRISNADAAWMAMALDTMLRPSTTRDDPDHDWYRLRAHGPDPDETIPLWPERYSLEKINQIRYGEHGRGGMAPFNFARQLMCNPMAEDSPRCERQWIERCKLRGIGESQVSSYDGPNPTYTGIDLAVGKKKDHDRTVFFTIEKMPDGSRKILNVESGKMSGPDIVKKTIQKAEAFGSKVWCENNAAQDFIRQFALEEKKDLHIHAHSTQSKNKWDADWGVESIFTEIQNGAWIIPCDRSGKCDPEVQRFIDQCLFYQPPPAHTGDFLMAAWIVREASRGRKTKKSPPSVGRRRELSSMGSF